MSYDDATCEASVWDESWTGLGSRLELCVDLGHVACLVVQYTPMHVSGGAGHGVGVRGRQSHEGGERAYHAPWRC